MCADICPPAPWRAQLKLPRPHSEESAESPAISLFYPISAFSLTSGEQSGERQVLVLLREILISPTDNPRGHLVVSDLPRCFQGQPHFRWRIESRDIESRDPASILINIILGLVSKQKSQVSKTRETVTEGPVLSFRHTIL